jgi:hemerythrin-like domain-containing protein
MADVMTAWHVEHVNFARLLDVLEGEVALFRDAGEPDFGCMRDVVSYLCEYPDRFHHPRENAAFARLVVREPGMRLPINRLLQEHRAIAVAGEELRARLNESIGGAPAGRGGVEAAAAIYLAYYRHHLAHEEREILPRAARLLTAQDWALVAAAIAPGADPLFTDEPEERYRALSAWLARASRER